MLITYYIWMVSSSPGDRKAFIAIEGMNNSQHYCSFSTHSPECFFDSFYLLLRYILIPVIKFHRAAQISHQLKDILTQRFKFNDFHIISRKAAEVC